MDTKDSRIRQLFVLYTNKTASAAEIEEFFELIANDKFNDELKLLIQNELEETDLQDGYDQQHWDVVLQKIKHTAIVQEGVPVKQSVSLYRRAIASAAAVLVLGICLFFFTRYQMHSPKSAQYTADIAPGKQGATLTLSNGKKISLDAVKGEISDEAGIVITKSADGQLIYKVQNSKTGKNNLNTLSTDKGETYALTLPDKSKVWLNASSSITYTASLYGDEKHAKRRIKLEGEAYFEVAKDALHPFVVESRGQEVEVLGTHFNINSYPNEGGIKTVLLEGRVKVSNGEVQKILAPGDQAVNLGNGIEVEKVDPELAIAWKNGIFQFYRADIKAVMRQLARWYNVEVEYQGIIPQREFTGKIFRKVNVSEALNILTELDVNFKIEGRKIIVTP